MFFVKRKNPLLKFKIAPPLNDMQVQIDTFPMDCSIRAIEAIDENSMWFGGSKGQFGYTEDGGQNWQIDSIKTALQPNLEFRGIAITETALSLIHI